MITIQQSVGRGGANRRDDVIAVQTQLNLVVRSLVPLAPLAVNGIADQKTIMAIKEFQRRILRLPNPDGRVDPNGKTLQALNIASIGVVGVGMAVVGAVGAALSTIPGLSGGGKVTYSPRLAASKRVVSPYSIKVVEQALAISGVSAAVITSTMRDAHDQATAMFPNAKKNLKGQYDMYGPSGDKILDVYAANATKSEATIIALMAQKVDELFKKGIRVSNHMFTAVEYASFNVFDIGMNSTQVAAGASYSVPKLTAAFKQLRDEGYIKKFIDETDRPNKCWHLEIVPNAKPLP